MQIPILKQGAYLIASLQSALNDDDLVRLCDALSTQAGKSRTCGVIVDTSALDVMNSFSTRTLVELATTITPRGILERMNPASWDSCFPGLPLT